MPNILDGLIARIEDPSLRAEIVREIALLRDHNEFGLVFERHLPETIRLNGYPVGRGCTVVDRTIAESRTWVVRRVDKGLATVLADDGSEEKKPVDTLAVVKEFGESINPGLRSVGRIERGGDKPFHTVINSENYHALQTLLYLYEGKVDCIYIDPPYNTGGRDWKYNNDYVDENDRFRHSKWLAFMDRRLKLAKQLLNPQNSVLICTIDENEGHRLVQLVEQLFRESRLQVITSVINPRGRYREGEFSRCDEYILFVTLGEARVIGEPDEDFAEGTSIGWRTLRRSDLSSARGTPKGGKSQFFPIYVNDENRRIQEIGEPLPHGVLRDSVPTRDGCTAVFPIRDDGTEMNWGLTPDSLGVLLAEGFVKVGAHTPSKPQQYTISYLTSGRVDDIRSGRAKVVGRDSTGAVIVTYITSKVRMPLTVWTKPSHNAETGGTNMIKALLGDKRFDYPKSLYAVEDALRFFVADKRDAVILDFFAGSGTTAHAVARLNRQDGGQRRSISITNNEVSEAAALLLRKQGHSPGDPAWEAEGIFRNVTVPRITAAITGRMPNGDWIDGDYKFTDEFPMADGFSENVEFFDLVYLDPDTVSRGRAFETVAPLLWLQARACGPSIDKEMPGYAIAEPNGRYAVLFDLARWQAFADELDKRPELTHAFVVTDSLAAYQEVLKALPTHLEVSMLYEDYLRNFEINTRDVR